ERAAAEFPDDLQDRVSRDLPRFLNRGVEKPAAVRLVVHELLRLEAPQNGADGRIGQRTILADRRAHGFARRRTGRPEKLEALLFQLAETFLTSHGSLSVTDSHVTNGNVPRGEVKRSR